MRHAGSTTLIALLLCMPACRDEALTQLVVVVDSDWDGFSRIEIEVGGFESAETTAAALSEQSLPRRVAIVHDGGPLGPISVQVSAFIDDLEAPVLVEPREDVYFVSGKTMLLSVVLRFECINNCDPGQACLGADRCVSAADAVELVEWRGEPEATDLRFRVEDGDVVRITESDGGGTQVVPSSGRDGGADGGGDAPDATTDAGSVPDAEPTPPPEVADSGFPFTVSNFDPDDAELAALERQAVVIDCAGASFDSDALSFTDWCGPEPSALVVTQSDDSEAALLVMNTLEVRTAGHLRLTGSRPVILAVFGGAVINGELDASARGTTPGPGADRGCAQPEPGANHTGSFGGGGGGGGGAFGGAGGGGGASEAIAGGVGAQASGEAALSPLRGGCSGAAGGDGSSDGVAPGGGGGGAVQLSAAGRVTLNGRVTATGGGGGVGPDAQDGGGGGGSGGGILLEGAELDVDSAAVISTAGGGGGAGQPHDGSGSEAGTDGSHADVVAAVGGSASGTGGDGGDGAAADTSGATGGDGSLPVIFGLNYGGGGGGGGGHGRVRVRGLDLCPPRGNYVPWPSAVCDGCGVCERPPEAGCTPIDASTRHYFLCASERSWDEARDRCQALGYSLARVSTEDENAALTAAVAGPTYLGGSDGAMEGDWVWPDGTLFWIGDAAGEAQEALTPWAQGEPNAASSGEDCLLLLPDGTWNDDSCASSRPWVCEPPPAP